MFILLFFSIRIGVKKVYVLIRNKRTFSYEDRLNKILNGNLFDKLRDIDEDFSKRIHLLNGSLEEDNIGLNIMEERNNVLENCEIVIHSAANVNFYDKMENLIESNLIGTENLLKLCKQMKNLQLFVYLSTAYSQVNHSPKVEEHFYEPIIPPIDLIRKHQLMKDKDFSMLFNYNLPKFMGENHVNYTLSKNVGESLVKSYENDFPIVVVRPSIGKFICPVLLKLLFIYSRKFRLQYCQRIVSRYHAGKIVYKRPHSPCWLF